MRGRSLPTGLSSWKPILVAILINSRNASVFATFLRMVQEARSQKKIFSFPPPSLTLDLQCLQTAVATARSSKEICDTSENLTVKPSICSSASLLRLGVRGDVVLLVFVTAAAVCMAVAIAMWLLAPVLTASRKWAHRCGSLCRSQQRAGSKAHCKNNYINKGIKKRFSRVLYSNLSIKSNNRWLENKDLQLPRFLFQRGFRETAVSHWVVPCTSTSPWLFLHPLSCSLWDPAKRTSICWGWGWKQMHGPKISSTVQC